MKLSILILILGLVACAFAGQSPAMTAADSPSSSAEIVDQDPCEVYANAEVLKIQADTASKKVIDDCTELQSNSTISQAYDTAFGPESTASAADRTAACKELPEVCIDMAKLYKPVYDKVCGGDLQGCDLTKAPYVKICASLKGAEESECVPAAAAGPSGATAASPSSASALVVSSALAMAVIAALLL